MIKIRDMTFAYSDQKPLFSQFHLTLEEGKRYCLMGASGQGKTTLLGLVCGLQKPQAGQILGMEGRRVSMVFQEERLVEALSAAANIRMGCLRGVFREETEGASDAGREQPVTPDAGRCSQQPDTPGRERLRGLIASHLEQVGLKEHAQRSVSDLSGGMRRRVSIVRAILSDSDIVLMDEPFAGIDAENKKEALAYIDRHLGGRTLVVVTHDEEDCAALGAQMVRL